VLQALVVVVEVALAAAEGHAEALVVPELGELVLEGGARRQLLEVAEGDLILGLDPGAGLGRVEVLHPAVRIGDLGAVVVVDGVAVPRRRVGEGGRRGRRLRGRGRGRDGGRRRGGRGRGRRGGGAAARGGDRDQRGERSSGHDAVVYRSPAQMSS